MADNRQQDVGLEIRQAAQADLPRIMDVYAHARAFMAEHGNPHQWGDTGWPPEGLVRRDVEQGKCYVCMAAGRIVGTFFYDAGPDVEPTYRTIERGQWLDGSPYGVVHRIASDGSAHGVGAACVDWAFARCGHLRMDTHPDNVVMQGLLGKLGFVRCGIVHVPEDPNPRIAYEKLPGGTDAPTTVIIDTDPGVDDAVALMLAASHPEALDVRLITSVGGNVSLDKTTRNCRIVEDFLHWDIPIARGTSATEAVPAEHVHGKEGLGVGDPWTYAQEWTPDKPGRSLLVETPALAAQAEVLRSSSVPVTIVALGPLTNVALLLRAYPELHDRIGRIVLMGGAIGRGNEAPYTEFNVGCDPDAAACVLSSGVPVVMLPVEVADAVALKPSTLKLLASLNPVGEAIATLMAGPEPSRPDQATKAMYDPTTIAYLVRPGLFSASRHRVEVELNGTFTRGATVIYDNPAGIDGSPEEPSDGITVCTDVLSRDEGSGEGDFAGFARWLFESVHFWDGRAVG